MEEKKHIDRLYQEKFKDFEATPREIVWKNISSRLQEKERKRSVLPVWYRIAGVAALLALFFNFASGLFRSSTPPSQVATTQQDNQFGEFNLLSPTYNENMFRSSIILQALILDTRKTELAENILAESKRQNFRSMTLIYNANRPDIITFPEYNESIISGSAIDFEVQKGVGNIKDSPTGTLRDIPLNKELPELTGEEIIEKLSPGKRLRITTTAAPVYFDNLGSGNSIDSRFADNESKGEISMAYGVNFAYQLSNRIKLRSGINKVDLSYNTRDIAFTAAVNPTVLSGIDYQGGVPNYRIENRASRPFSNISASTEFNRSSLASPATGYLNQKLGFIEVPVEIEYVIIDKKIGLNIIGGGSTLFLDENMVSLNSANFSTNIGESNNINSLSFSTNIGIGIDYKISPQFQFNLEPIFKYQINTFRAEDINPYFFGIYSGFSFKF
ncbi:hypothetical protein BH23BAC2_BH23BAC2_08640 [soil metagenome]